MSFSQDIDSAFPALDFPIDQACDLSNFSAKGHLQENFFPSFPYTDKMNFSPDQESTNDMKTSNTEGINHSSYFQGQSVQESLFSSQEQEIDFYSHQIENSFTRNDSYEQGRLPDTSYLESAFKQSRTPSQEVYYQKRRIVYEPAEPEIYIQTEKMVLIQLPKEKKPKSKSRINNKEISAMQANLCSGEDCLALPKELRAKNKKVCTSETKSRTESTKGSNFSTPIISSPFSIENEFQFDLNNEGMWENEIEIEGITYRVPAMDQQVECFIDNILSSEKQEKKENKKASTLPQNKKRNLPGMISMRVAASTTKVLKEQCSQELNYIQNIFTQYGFVQNENSVTEFLAFLKNFDGKGKTYEWVKSKVSLNLYYGRLFRAIVDAFLSEEGKQDFRAWIQASSRMRDDSKNALMNEKDEFRVNFEQRLIDL